MKNTIEVLEVELFCSTWFACICLFDNLWLMFCSFFKTHAEYNESGEYAPHRAVQAYQLSQFVHHLTKPSDTVLVCGDMNCEPSQLFYRIIKDVAGLIDAWDKHGTIKVRGSLPL